MSILFYICSIHAVELTVTQTGIILMAGGTLREYLTRAVRNCLLVVAVTNSTNPTGILRYASCSLSLYMSCLPNVHDRTTAQTFDIWESNYQCSNKLERPANILLLSYNSYVQYSKICFSCIFSETNKKRCPLLFLSHGILTLDMITLKSIKLNIHNHVHICPIVMKMMYGDLFQNLNPIIAVKIATTKCNK